MVSRIFFLLDLIMQTALVVGMVGITYLSVPLYRMFCQVLRIFEYAHSWAGVGHQRYWGHSSIVLEVDAWQRSHSDAICLDSLCLPIQATGFGGTVQRTETVEEKIRNRTEEEER